MLKTFNFEIIFICNNTNEQKQIIKEYRDINYIEAKQGIKEYCNTNKTYKKVLSLKCVKFGTKIDNLL